MSDQERHWETSWQPATPGPAPSSSAHDPESTGTGPAGAPAAGGVHPPAADDDPDATRPASLPYPPGPAYQDPTHRVGYQPEGEYRPEGAAGGYPPPYPGAGAPPTGRGALPVLGLVALMVIAAVGGGIAGASLYAHAVGDGADGRGNVRVVNGPQLEYESLASIASQVSPSVVSIRIGEFGGSGVVMSEDGYILTNAHVVEAARNQQVAVRFSDGQTVPASVVGADRRSDIAVIKTEQGSGLTPAEFGDSGEVLVGDTVLAIGSPLGYEGSITQGIVSARDRTLRPEAPGSPTLSGLLQTDAAINRGNSGGALVNLSGEVVGINTAIAVADEDSGFLGLGFAVPSNRATDVAQRLIDGEEVTHAFLGVVVGPAEEGGALIGEVAPDSPAAEAGLEPGDVVLRLGERPITSADDLVSAVQSAEVGDTLEIEFRRDGRTERRSVTVTEAPD